MSLPGINLLDTGKLRERDQLFGEVFAHDVAALEQPAASLLYRWTIAGRWKLIVPDPVNRPDASTELYDVISDPSESIDRSAEMIDWVGRLSADVDAWWSPKQSIAP